MALRGAWNFNEASGNSTDQSGNGFTAVVPAGVTRVPGHRGGTDLAASRMGRHATATGALVASGATAWSISMWYYHATNSLGSDLNLGTIFRSGGELGGIYISSGGNLGGFVNSTAGTQDFTANDRPIVGAWNHIAMTWDGAIIRLYVNGVARNETRNLAGTTQGVATHFDIGAVDAWWTTEQASLDRRTNDVRVYNHAQTVAEINLDMMTPVGWTAGAVTKFPTTVDGNIIKDQSGNPWFGKGLSAWALMSIAQPLRPAFIAGAEERGYNFMYVGAVSGAPAADGTTWATAHSGTAPVEAYWLQIDEILTLAAARGITVFLDIFETFDTYHSTFYAPANTNSSSYSLGQFLGNRYKTRTNLVWLMGGDWGLPHNSTHSTLAKNILDGIQSTGDAHHISFHWTEENTGTEGDATLNPYATLSLPYTYTPTYREVREGYATGKPNIMFEANYELENNNYPSHTTTDLTLRRQMLWTVTAGGHGHGYGVAGVWNALDGAGGGSADWRLRMVTGANTQLKKLNERWSALEWWKLVPDTGNTLVTSGRGTELTTFVAGGAGAVDVLANDYASAAIATDKSLAVVYVPDARAVTLDMTKVGSTPTITRVDPTGVVADTTLTSTIASGSFPAHADGTTDWLLIITATATGGAATKTGTATAIASASATKTSSRTKTNTGTALASASAIKTSSRARTGTASAIASASSVSSQGGGTPSKTGTAPARALASSVSSTTRVRSATALLLASASAVVASIRNVTGTATAVATASVNSQKQEVAHLFTPPGRIERRGTHRLFGRLPLVQGVSLLRENGLYRQVEAPTDEEVSAAEVVYLGGRVYHITDAEMYDLSNAGYGQWIS